MVSVVAVFFLLLLYFSVCSVSSCGILMNGVIMNAVLVNFFRFSVIVLGKQIDESVIVYGCQSEVGGCGVFRAVSDMDFVGCLEK